MAAGGSAQRKADELAVQVDAARERLRVLEKQAGAWAAGAHGERLVAEALERCELDGGVLHDRLLSPGQSEVNLDHVVVSTAGVFVLDTKNWTGALSVDNDMLWVHRSGPDGRRRLARDREIAKVGGYADAMAAKLGVQVHPLIVLANDAHAGFEPQVVAGVPVVPVNRLREWFMRQPIVIDDAQRDLIGLLCQELFPETVNGLIAGAGNTRRPRHTPAANRGATPARATRSRRPRSRPAAIRTAKATSGAGRALASLMAGGVVLLLVSQAGWVSTKVASVVGAVMPAVVTHTSRPLPPLSTPKATTPGKVVKRSAAP